MRARIEAALAAATSWLDQAQLESGELPVYASTDPTLAERAELDPSIFPSAVAALSLSHWPPAHPVRDRICAFLQSEMERRGLWKHWPRSHPHASSLPYDLDDTSCASAALAAAGIKVPDNRALLLANRDGEGRFFTWFSPRLRWSGVRHMALAWRGLAHAPSLFFFFRRTSAKPRDIDAAVNANALFHLGRFEGDAAVVAWLVAILRENRETQCDKWYEDPFVVRYFFARALAGRSEEGSALLRARLASSRPQSALHRALAACAGIALGTRPGPEEIAALLALQMPDGAWPRAALYHGGRARLAGGGFAPPHPDTPRWGSEAVTTAFAVEALSRTIGADRE
jgi:hypothetical protein